MNSLSRYFYSRSTYTISLLLTVALVIYASLVMGSQSRCISEELQKGYSLLDLKFAYDLDYVISMFSSLSEEALKCYRNFLLIWDNLFPIIYGSMYIFWVSLIYRKFANKKFVQLINLYPLVPALLDLLENFLEVKLITAFLETGTLSEKAVLMTSSVTQMKWSASYLNYLFIAIGIAIIFINRYKQRKAKDIQKSHQ